MGFQVLGGRKESPAKRIAMTAAADDSMCARYRLEGNISSVWQGAYERKFLPPRILFASSDMAFSRRHCGIKGGQLDPRLDNAAQNRNAAQCVQMMRACCPANSRGHVKQEMRSNNEMAERRDCEN